MSLGVCVRSVLPSQEAMTQRFPRALGFRKARELSHSGNGELWPGWLCPWGAAASLLALDLSPGLRPWGRVWGSPPGRRAPGGSGLASPGPSHAPRRPRINPRAGGRSRSPSGAAPSAAVAWHCPADKQPGSPGQPRRWAATCFRSGRNRPGLGGGGGAG